MRVEVLLRYLTNVQKFAALPVQSSCSILPVAERLQLRNAGTATHALALKFAAMLATFAECRAGVV